MDKRQLKAEQDKTYAAKKNIRRSKSKSNSNTARNDRDMQYLSGLVPFQDLTPENHNKEKNDHRENREHSLPRNVPPPSPPTSSRLMGYATGPLTDRSQSGTLLPPPPLWNTNTTNANTTTTNTSANTSKKPHRNTPIFDEENYYHDKAYKNNTIGSGSGSGLNGDDSATSSDDDFSDDSDLDEVCYICIECECVCYVLYEKILYNTLYNVLYYEES